MLGRESQSEVQKFTYIHPFYAHFIAIATPIITFGWAPEFEPMLFISFLFLEELEKKAINKISNPPALKTESIFKEKEFEIDEITAGKITHYGSQPVVEVFPDGLLRELIKATLMAPYVLKFYYDYLSYLLMAVYTKYGAWSLDPIEAAISDINNQIDQRQLDLSAVDAASYYMCLEISILIDQYNKTAPFYRQIAKDKFGVELFFAVAALVERAKGLGAEGCSTAVLPLADGVKGLVGNLDWFNIFFIFHLFLVHFMETTPHFNKQEKKENSEKPEMTFSSTVPGISAITIFNNLMLVVVYNEVGGKKGNRQNGPNASPGMILAKKITDECSTWEEVLTLLKTYQPASTCHLTIVARDKHGVLQCMHYDSEKSFDVVEEKTCVATNHFFNEKGDFMNSAPVPDSKKRKGQMSAEVEAQLPQLQDLHKKPMTSAVLDAVFERLRQIAVKPTTAHDTIKTILAKLDYNNNRCLVRMNSATYNASFAPNEKGQLHFDEIDLTRRFETFGQNVKRFYQEYNRSNGPEKKEFKAQCDIDQTVIDLLPLARQAGSKHPELGVELRHLSTALIYELSQKKPSAPGLSPEKVQSIAVKTKGIVNFMLDDKSINKVEAWARYKNWLQRELPQATISYNPAKIPDALFRVFMCICMSATLKFLAEKSPSMDFANSAYTAFIDTLWKAIPEHGMTLLTSAYMASRILFKKPLLKGSADELVKILEKLPSENKPSVSSRFGFGR